MKLIPTEEKRDTSYDLRRRIALHVGFLIIVAVIFPAMVLFAGFTRTTKHGNITNGMTCFADGSAHLFGRRMTPLRPQAWDPSLFLSITLGFANLTFPAAKGIDITWDLLVGRGGQLLLTMLTYRLMRRTLLFCIERKPASFRLFSSLTFGGVSVPSLYALSLRRPLTGKSNHDRIRTWLCTGLFLMVVYILAFPTLVSVMSGYQSKLAPYAKDPDDPENLLPVHDLSIPRFVVVDGQRLGLNDHLQVEWPTSLGVSDAQTISDCKWRFMNDYHQRRG